MIRKDSFCIYVSDALCVFSLPCWCEWSANVSRHMYRSNWSSYAPSQLDSSLVTNIQKLFSERIEIFSSVEFSKVSILTGIIKISLKTFLECVRLRTFSRYGLQQIQVDTHYLQLYLWRFVADENLVHFLLDEILGSAVHRCLDPVLMEPSVVEIICERGWEFCCIRVKTGSCILLKTFHIFCWKKAFGIVMLSYRSFVRSFLYP